MKHQYILIRMTKIKAYDNFKNWHSREIDHLCIAVENVK